MKDTYDQLMDAAASLGRLEARNERLQEALREVVAVGSSATGYDELEECIEIARTALFQEGIE